MHWRFYANSALDLHGKEVADDDPRSTAIDNRQKGKTFFSSSSPWFHVSISHRPQLLEFSESFLSFS
jgi:hypothetical protein